MASCISPILAAFAAREVRPGASLELDSRGIVVGRQRIHRVCDLLEIAPHDEGDEVNHEAACGNLLALILSVREPLRPRQAVMP